MPTQQLDFPFAGGIDEKTRGELVEPGAALGVNNLRQLKNGSYEKRRGNASFGPPTDLSGNAIPTQKRLVGYRDEVCSTDNLNLYSYLPTLGRWRKATGYTPQLDIKAISVAPTQYELHNLHVMYLNGYQILAYTQGKDSAGANASIYVEVLDARGVVVIPPRALNATVLNTVQVSLTSAGNVAVLCYGVDNSRTIFAYTLDTTTSASVAAGWSARQNLVTNMFLGQVSFDTCSLGSSFVLAYVDTSAEAAPLSQQQQLTVVRFNSALAAQATNTTINTGAGAGDPVTCVSVSGNSADVVFVAYSLDTTFVLECVGLDPSTLALTATRAALSGVHTSALRRCTVLWTSTNNGIAMYNDVLNFPGGGVRRFTVTPGAPGTIVPASTNEYVFFGMSSETKLFAANSRVYSGMRPARTNLVGTADNLQLLLIDWTATLAEGDFGYQRVAGNINPRLSLPTSDVNSNPSCVAALSSTNVIIPCATKKSAIGASIDLVSLDWAATTMSQAAVLGDDVALSGSPPSFYDGVHVSEIGFFQKPTILSNTVTGSAGPDSTTGNYNYVAIFEQMDDRGQWHQSDISLPFLPNPQPAGGKAVVLVCSTLGATNRMVYTGTPADTPQSIRVVFYRTTAGGTIYYRVPGSETANAPSAQSITFTDAITDDFLLAHGIPLYTQPGIPNVAQAKVTPPCFTAMFTHGNRLIGLNAKSVWFSGEYVLGDGFWFADAFQFAVEGGDGDLVAGASMDGAMVLFKRNAIAFVDGSGPPDNGAGGDFSPPQFIAADVGCIEPRSVVLTPAGVMFQSLRGIEMLSRGRSLSTYFGSHAEATLAANPVVTSAVLDEAKATVKFTCMPSESATTGVEIVWDYVHNIWLTDTADSGTAVRSAIMAGHQPGTVPVYTWLAAAAGDIYQESTSLYTDAGGYVSGRITPPWVKMSGLQGYGRTCGVSLLLESRTACDILVTIRQDYRSDVVQTRLFTAAEIATLGTPTELYVTFKTQKCSSFQMTLEDATPTGGPSVGTGQGPAWIGMRIEYQQKQGTNRTTRLAGA